MSEKRDADRGLRGDFHGGPRRCQRRFRLAAVRKNNVNRFIGPDRCDLVPGDRDGAELVRLHDKVVSVLLDDSARYAVAVLQHNLVRPQRAWEQDGKKKGREGAGSSDESHKQ